MADDFLKEKIDLIAESLEYMDRVVLQINEVCEQLRKKEGIDAVGKISEGLMAILKIIEHTKSITNIEIDEENITGFVSDMIEGMENGDYNLVADILEYELKPLYEEWADIFADTIEKNID